MEPAYEGDGQPPPDIPMATGEDEERAALLAQFDGETAFQLFGPSHADRPLGTFNIPLFDEEIQGGFMYGDVVEITGHSGSGKTELLYQVAAGCILPKKWNSIEIAGREVAVVFFDLDYHFSLLRFMVVLEAWVRRKIEAHQGSSSPHGTPSDEEIEDLLTESLTRLHLFHCESSLQFLATVHSLPYLLDQVPDVKVVMVDSISAFHWIDKMESQVRDEQEYNQRQFVYAMRNLLQNYRLLLLVTKPVYFVPNLTAGPEDPGAPQADGAAPFPTISSVMNSGPSVPFALMHREHMSQTWLRFVRYRFIIARLSTSGLAKPKFIGKALQPPGRKMHYFTIQDGL